MAAILPQSHVVLMEDIRISSLYRIDGTRGRVDITYKDGYQVSFDFGDYSKAVELINIINRNLPNTVKLEGGAKMDIKDEHL